LKRYEALWRRLLAGLIDGVVLAPVPLVINYISTIYTGPILFILWCGLEFSADWIYSVLFHWRYGQTLGKKVMRVKLLDISESRVPSLRQAAARDAIYIAVNSLAVVWVIYLVLVEKVSMNAIGHSLPRQLLSYIGFGWFILEMVTLCTNKKGRAFQDWMAGTVVVRTGDEVVASERV
jgi:uncharacterized RDD family membrane protein YckC